MQSLSKCNNWLIGYNRMSKLNVCAIAYCIRDTDFLTARIRMRCFTCRPRFLTRRNRIRQHLNSRVNHIQTKSSRQIFAVLLKGSCIQKCLNITDEWNWIINKNGKKPHEWTKSKVNICILSALREKKIWTNIYIHVVLQINFNIGTIHGFQLITNKDTHTHKKRKTANKTCELYRSSQYD